MPNLRHKMPSLQGVGAGQTASVQLPKGYTYERLMIIANVDSGTPRLLPAAEFGDYFGEVRVLVDGRATIRIAAGDLVSLNAFKNHATEAGVMALHLAQPHMRTPEGEDYGAYGTASNIQSLSFEIECTAGKVFNSVEVYALLSAPRPFGSHYSIRRFPITQGIAGEREVSDIPRSDYSLIGAHLTTDGVSSVMMHADQMKIVETVPAIANLINKEAGRVPQAGFTHIDLPAKNRLTEVLPMTLQDFRIKYEFTATGNFDLYVERFAGRNG